MKSAPPAKQASARIGLLVSVRSLDELNTVANLEIDVLDFKEPRLGPLAAASPELWHQAAAEAPLDCQLSAALGEWDGAVELAGLVPPRFTYAKAGPAGVQTIGRLVDSWARIRELLAGNIELVAVAYADHEQAECPEPEAIFQAAAEAGIRTWLLDTFEKADHRNSISWLGIERLAEIQRMAVRHDARWVLAGSISRQAARELLHQGIGPTMFGARGDVCEGSRGGQIVRAKVVHWLDVLRPFAQQANQGNDRQRTEAQA